MSDKDSVSLQVTITCHVSQIENINILMSGSLSRGQSGGENNVRGCEQFVSRSAQTGSPWLGLRSDQVRHVSWARAIDNKLYTNYGCIISKSLWRTVFSETALARLATCHVSDLNPTHCHTQHQIQGDPHTVNIFLTVVHPTCNVAHKSLLFETLRNN